MGTTGSGRVAVAPWTTELSAAASLAIGTWYVVAGSPTAEPGAVGTVATLVVAALACGGLCLAVGLLGRVVSLPVRRERALNAAAALGLGAVVGNGALAGRSVLAAKGPGHLLTFTALIVVAVAGLLGGLFAFGRAVDS